MPMLTIWHEVGGHVAACLVQGGTVQEIGAFYVRCSGLNDFAQSVLAGAGVAANVALASIAWLIWRRTGRSQARLIWWWIWITQALVAAGYLAFSGLTGAGDLGLGHGGGLASSGLPQAAGYLFIIVGVFAYWLIIRAGIGSLSEMLGTGPTTRSARKRLTVGYYVAAGLAAVAVGLLNPQGLFVTIMSAAASTFGGLAGLLTIGAKAGSTDAPRDVVIERSIPVILGGLLVVTAFAVLLGPGYRP